MKSIFNHISISHIYREQNQEADSASKEAVGPLQHGWEIEEPIDFTIVPLLIFGYSYFHILSAGCIYFLFLWIISWDIFVYIIDQPFGWRLENF